MITIKSKCLFIKIGFISPILLLLSFFSNSFPQVATLETSLVLKQVDGITLPFQNGLPLPSFEKQNRKTIDLAGTWKKEGRAADKLLKRRNSGRKGPL